jgi:hypothetical protein
MRKKQVQACKCGVMQLANAPQRTVENAAQKKVCQRQTGFRFPAGFRNLLFFNADAHAGGADKEKPETCRNQKPDRWHRPKSAYVAVMSNAEPAAPKQRVIGTPFPKGTSGNPSGRPRGSRNRLADAFITDVRDVWEVHGRDALERVARDEPATLLKVVASLMPRDVDINLTATVDSVSFAERFRAAVELLGNAPQAKMRTIEHKATSSARKPA